MTRTAQLIAELERCIVALIVKVPVWVKQDSGPRPGQQGRITDRFWIQQRPEPATAGRLL